MFRWSLLLKSACLWYWKVSQDTLFNSVAGRLSWYFEHKRNITHYSSATVCKQRQLAPSVTKLSTSPLFCSDFCIFTPSIRQCENFQRRSRVFLRVARSGEFARHSWTTWHHIICLQRSEMAYLPCCDVGPVSIRYSQPGNTPLFYSALLVNDYCDLLCCTSIG